MRIRLSTKIPLRPLDGGGSVLRQPFLDFIRGNTTLRDRAVDKVVRWIEAQPTRIPALSGVLGHLERCRTNRSAPYRRRYRRVFEWCSGPGFIGFHLLENGICDTLCLADINPLAIESARMTVAENGLESRVSTFVSDNFDSILGSEKFDLIVSNPPNYYSLNPQHPGYEKMKDDLRPNDPEWRIHSAFYANVHKFLLPGALLMISEVEPESDRVFIPRTLAVPYDIRPRPALADFKRMIAEGGLEYLEGRHYFTMQDTELWMIVSRFPG